MWHNFQNMSIEKPIFSTHNHNIHIWRIIVNTHGSKKYVCLQQRLPEVHHIMQGHKRWQGRGGGGGGWAETLPVPWQDVGLSYYNMLVLTHNHALDISVLTNSGLEGQRNTGLDTKEVCLPSVTNVLPYGRIMLSATSLSPFLYSAAAHATRFDSHTEITRLNNIHSDVATFFS